MGLHPKMVQFWFGAAPSLGNLHFDPMIPLKPFETILQSCKSYDPALRLEPADDPWFILVIRRWDEGTISRSLSPITWRRKNMSGWWFQTFFIFHNIWDNTSHWLIFFKMVKKPPARCVLYLFFPVSHLPFEVFLLIFFWRGVHRSSIQGAPSGLKDWLMSSKLWDQDRALTTSITEPWQGWQGWQGSWDKNGALKMFKSQKHTYIYMETLRI